MNALINDQFIIDYRLYLYCFSSSGGDRRQRPLLEKTRPFVLVGRKRRSLAEALQDGHPDRLQCGLEVGGRLLLLDLHKNHGLLPRAPSLYYYLANGTGVTDRAHAVTHCYYHGNVRGFPDEAPARLTHDGHDVAGRLEGLAPDARLAGHDAGVADQVARHREAGPGVPQGVLPVGPELLVGILLADAGGYSF
ncbi:Disintegrin and metalloproteinase domain-containing protein 15 [Liparis tanakae]|uniref:Disintegrin and metalloproteinase domain-containing protein 15 n=1 Tax=Liparis tanakae TaxID=230148 RepID=A0A4Z2FJB1_9TELE|nr:Disintegrin and metalloproteinase domain-containing protein 15 [Liparis tanakae]